MQQIVLASSSPRRKTLLTKAGLLFEIHPSAYEEAPKDAPDPHAYAVEQAIEKARDVAQHYKTALIIGADTVVAIDNQILGKPRDKAHAMEMLQQLNNQTHEVITGYAVINTKNQKEIMGAETSRVTFKNVSREDMDAYIATGQPMDKAGAYGVQDGISSFIEKTEGDYANIVGLPVKQVLSALDGLMIHDTIPS
jgi:septum formation protein